MTPKPTHFSNLKKGLIVFCETNLRYENGFKAWIFLVPYFLGGIGLEMIIETDHTTGFLVVAQWLGFLAYLILFPHFWRRILNGISARKVSSRLAR